MVEDTKDKPPSPQKNSEAEKEPAATTLAPMGVTSTPPVWPPWGRPAATPSRVAAVPPRPQAPIPASPAPQAPKDKGRRTFVKALFAIGAILSIAPFVPWGTFLTSSVTTGIAKTYLLQKVRVDQNSKYGAASGQMVNVNDLTTFPANNHWVMTYPSSGDPTIDSQNPDTFLKWELIRLPTELGGGSKKATDFVAFSKVCVHLWCSPNYNPGSGHQQYECPCHGSIYEVPDGKAVLGPAALQAAPANAIPMLTLQADSSGQLYVVFPNRDPTKPFGSDQVDPIEANGELGYGRDYASYQNFIKPVGQQLADVKGLTEEIGA